MSAVNIWYELLEVSKKMDAAASRLDLDALAVLESERRSLLGRLPPRWEVEPETKGAEVAALIRQIQDCDHRVRGQIDPWAQQIAVLLGKKSGQPS